MGRIGARVLVCSKFYLNHQLEEATAFMVPEMRTGDGLVLFSSIYSLYSTSRDHSLFWVLPFKKAVD